MNVNGKVSWFGGPGDPTDSGHTANGETTHTPGIAIYNHKTLGGYWRVRAPNGKTAVVKQTDIGPAPWTGRKIDVTYSAVGKFGYGTHNFPTNSEFKAEYLGHKPPAAGAQAELPLQAQQKPAEAQQTPSLPTFNKAAYQKASSDAMLGRLLQKTPGSEALTQVLGTREPERSEFMGGEAKPEGPAPRTPGFQNQAPASSGLGGGVGAVTFAVSRLGKYGETAGSNRGTELDQLEAKFGMTGEPWCAIFATTAVAHGGGSTAVRTASVAQINQWASEGSHGYKRGLLPDSQAHPGDLLTFGSQHVALVKEVRNGQIITIEGNANGSGGVAQHSHPVGSGKIARPRYPQHMEQHGSVQAPGGKVVQGPGNPVFVPGR